MLPQGAKRFAFVGEMGLLPSDLAAVALPSECSIRFSVIELKRIEGGPTAITVATQSEIPEASRIDEADFYVRSSKDLRSGSTKGPAPFAFPIPSDLGHPVQADVTVKAKGAHGI